MGAVDILIKGSLAEEIKIACIIMMSGLKSLPILSVGKMMMENIYFFFVDRYEPFCVFDLLSVIDVIYYKPQKERNKESCGAQSNDPIE